jgi:hypothetical protein
LSLTTADRLQIHEVIALHGHLCDAAAYDRFDEVFSPDLEVDTSDLGRRQLPPGDPSRSRLDAYIAAAHRIGPGDTVALHVTNILVRDDADGARAWSKGLAVKRDGSTASFTYNDHLVRAAQGWRIDHRKVSPRREPGTGAAPSEDEDRAAPPSGA